MYAFISFFKHCTFWFEIHVFRFFTYREQALIHYAIYMKHPLFSDMYHSMSNGSKLHTKYKIMINFGALNWFGYFIKKLKKTLDCIHHMIYTCVYIKNSLHHLFDMHITNVMAHQLLNVVYCWIEYHKVNYDNALNWWLVDSWQFDNRFPNQFMPLLLGLHNAYTYLLRCILSLLFHQVSRQVLLGIILDKWT